MWRRGILKTSSSTSRSCTIITSIYGGRAQPPPPSSLQATLPRRKLVRTISISRHGGNRHQLQQKLAKNKGDRQKSTSTTTTTAKTEATASTTIPSTAASPGEVAAVEPLSRSQIYSIFWQAAIPMIGFGFMDQTVMLQAGNAIDCSIGVTFGLSTLTAAALGQVCSDASGVIFGGTVERFFTYMQITKPLHLSAAQHTLPIVSQTRFVGTLIGVILGCSLGLLNLLFIDTSRSSTLKLQAYTEEDGSDGGITKGFEIEASNDMHETATALIVKGPDVDGLLASMTATLALQGCSIVEIHASKAKMIPSTAAAVVVDNGNNAEDDEQSDLTTENNSNPNTIHDTIYVVKQGTYEKYDDEELEELAQALLDSTKLAPSMEHNIHMINNTIQSKLKELETTNQFLKAKVKQLEMEKEATTTASVAE